MVNLTRSLPEVVVSSQRVLFQGVGPTRGSSGVDTEGVGDRFGQDGRTICPYTLNLSSQSNQFVSNDRFGKIIFYRECEYFVKRFMKGKTKFIGSSRQLSIPFTSSTYTSQKEGVTGL